MNSDDRSQSTEVASENCDQQLTVGDSSGKSLQLTSSTHRLFAAYNLAAEITGSNQSEQRYLTLLTY